MTKLFSDPADQELQARSYFNERAVDWLELSYGDPGRYSVARERDSKVLGWIHEQPPGLQILDLGCGDGSLLKQCAKAGHRGTGIDFSPAMIAAARSGSLNEQSVNFLTGSVFESSIQPHHHVALALGLIEYFPRQKLPLFLQRVVSALLPGGKLFLHVRNRLFNIFSANGYTEEESALGQLQFLKNEISQWQMASDEQAFHRVVATTQNPSAPSPAVKQGDIPVARREQFTPAQTIRYLTAAGLQPMKLYPVHFHALPPSTNSEVAAKNEAAAWAHSLLREPKLATLAQCSSFLVLAEKRVTS